MNWAGVGAGGGELTNCIPIIFSGAAAYTRWMCCPSKSPMLFATAASNMALPPGTPHAAPKSYLSELSVEVVNNVIRLCSERPNWVDWTEYLSASILGDLAGVIPGVLECCFCGICEGRDAGNILTDLGPFGFAALRLGSPSLSIPYAENSFA